MINSAIRGEYSEQRFVIQALGHDWKISKPLEGSESYDFIADCDGLLFKVQVKRSYKDEKGRNVVDLRRSKKGRPTINFKNGILAVDCENQFYLIPTNLIIKKKSNICVSGKGSYSDYLNRWNFDSLE